MKFMTTFLLGATLFSNLVFPFKTQLTILSINDVYEVLPKQGIGGFAELYTLLKEERMRAKESIFTVNGDFLFPSLLSMSTHGAHMVSLFNDLGVDYVVFGNHEFDFGSDIVRSRVKESTFLWLGTNVQEYDSGNPFASSLSIHTRQIKGLKVGFLGLCTEETRSLSQPGDDVVFTPFIEGAKEAVKALKDQDVDLIIALTHLHFEDDLHLARAVPEISLILGGHEHHPITWLEGKTLIHKSGQDAAYLARIVLNVDKQSKKTVITPEWQMKGVWDVEADPEIKAKIALMEEKLDEELNKPVGVTLRMLDSRTQVARKRESSMGNMMADALRSYFNSDVALINGGTIRGNRIYEENSTLLLRDIYTELPFSNWCVFLQMSGKDLLATLEHGVSSAEQSSGKFLQVSGIQFFFDINKPIGKRVKDVQIQGRPLVLDKSYLVATLEYLVSGGDGYKSFKKAKILVDHLHGPLLNLVIKDYLQGSQIMDDGSPRIISHDN